MTTQPWARRAHLRMCETIIIVVPAWIIVGMPTLLILHPLSPWKV